MKFRVVFALVCGLVFLFHILWLGCRSEIKATGRRPAMYWVGTDMKSMHAMIRETADLEKKQRYRLLLYALYGSAVLAVLTFIAA